ncbi:MAG: hypothetical protein NTU89_01410 [Candidatus Dependentiae bacterium]|nr:hypothetical protein [Candidatus Dependentiae bacterium]
MNKNIFSILFLIGFSCSLLAHEFEISRFVGDDLSTHKAMFIEFWQETFATSGKQTSLESLSKDFDEYQDAYQEAYQDEPETAFFLQATFMDQVIGYISFEVSDFDHVMVHHVILDRAMSDSTLIKALVLSIFDYVPQCRGVRVLQDCLFPELIEILLAVGFVEKTQIEEMFDLIVHDRCKLCQATYKPEFWEIDEESDEDDFE